VAPEGIVMIGIAIAVFSVLLPLIHLYVSKMPRTKLRVIHILMIYVLVIDVGVMGFLFGFIPTHLFPQRDGGGHRLGAGQSISVPGWHA
jgi:hypothetical protein